MRKWPPCSSLVLSVLIALYAYSFLCESSSDEDVATLLLSISVYPHYFICICLRVNLVVMRMWPPCSSLVLSVLISLYAYSLLCESSSDEEVATLLLSISICPDLSLCLFLVV